MLSLFYNICLQPESSVEKGLARRQLAIKTATSHSWFLSVRQLLWKYSLPDAEVLLQGPFTRTKWKATVDERVHSYWKEDIQAAAKASRSLKLCTVTYAPGKPHPALRIPLPSRREFGRIPTKLRILTGTYILQTNRAAFNQNSVDPTCRLCSKENEDVAHFLLRCPELKKVRDKFFPRIRAELKARHATNFERLSTSLKLKTLVDCTVLMKGKGARQMGDKHLQPLEEINSLCLQYMFNAHCARYRALSIPLPQRRRRAK